MFAILLCDRDDVSEWQICKNPWDKADINSLFLLQIWLLPYYQFYCCSCWLVILLIYSLTTSKKAPSDRYTFNFVTPEICGRHVQLLLWSLDFKYSPGLKKCHRDKRQMHICTKSVQLKDWELISNGIQKRWNSKLRHTELNVLLYIWAKNRKWLIMQTQNLFRIQSRWWTI